MLRWLTLLGAMLAALVVKPVPAHAQELSDRIVAVGDLHGDYEAWLDIASVSGVSVRGKGWTGGTTTLVQLGDITDRGPDSLKIIRHFQRLEKEALKSGGRVVVLLGNHEAMNVIGDLRYVDPGEYAAFASRNSDALRLRMWRAIGPERIAQARLVDPQVSEEAVRADWLARTPPGMVEHRLAWAPHGELGQWAARRPAIVLIDGLLFAHGGISLEASGDTLEAINARHAAALAIIGPESRTVLENPLGPLWYRGNSAGAPDQSVRPAPDGELATVLAGYGAKRLVVAHTPSPSGIALEGGGRLVRIDTGISASYGGTRSFLEVRGHTLFAHEKGKDGKWTSRLIAQPAADGDESR